jgi:hypothetical protein
MSQLHDGVDTHGDLRSNVENFDPNGGVGGLETQSSSALPGIQRNRGGRPKGSRNKRTGGARVGRGNSSADNNNTDRLLSETGENDDDVDEASQSNFRGVGQSNEKGEKSRENEVQLCFMQANQVRNPQSKQSEDGHAIFLNGGAILPGYLSCAAKEVWENSENDLEPASVYLRSMATVSRSWRIISPEWVNKDLTWARNTGPCLCFCIDSHTPNLPQTIKELAWLVSCINNMTNYDECVLPTENTRLKWNESFTHIVGIQHAKETYGEMNKQLDSLQAINTRRERRIFGCCIPNADEISYKQNDDEEIEDKEFVTVDAALLVVSIVPARYQFPDDDERQKKTFWVATILPQPGLNLLKCIEKICKPFDPRNTSEVQAAEERCKVWSKLCAKEASQAYNITMQPWDSKYSSSALDNYSDRKHPFQTASVSSTYHKMLQAIPQDADEHSVAFIGMPKFCDAQGIHDYYKYHMLQKDMAREWVQEFDNMMKIATGLRARDRQYIPAITFPVVPAMPMQMGTEYVYFQQLPEAPLNLLWKPMEKTDLRLSFMSFSTGNLPSLFEGMLMTWMMSGNIDEFVPETDACCEVSEALLFERYYKGKNSAIDDMAKAGHMTHWMQAVWNNIQASLKAEVENEVNDPALVVDWTEQMDDDAWEAMQHRAQQLQFSPSQHSKDDSEEEEGMATYSDLNESDRDLGKENVAQNDAVRDNGEESSVAGSMEGSVEGSMEGSVEGSMEGSVEGSVQGSVEGSVQGSVDKRSVNPGTDISTLLRMTMDKMQDYNLTGWRWYCSMVEGGIYNSALLEDGVKIIRTNMGLLSNEMQSFVSKFLVQIPVRNGNPCLQVHTSAAMIGCFAFQGAILHVNTISHMNAVNLTTFREIFTSSVGHYLGPNNKTFANFFHAMVVACGFANFAIDSPTQGTLPYWVKPNASGLDAVLMATVRSCRMLFQAKMKTTDPMSQGFILLSRATSKAFENIGRITTESCGKVVELPLRVTNYQLIIMTELRKLTASFISTIIVALPRHDQSTDTANVVLSTDISQNAGGGRRGTESHRRENPKLLICATNCAAELRDEGEALQTLRAAVVVMPPGGNVDDGKLNRKRKIDEVHHDASKLDCQFFTKDSDKEEIFPGLCLAPLLATHIAQMNYAGMARMEISEMVTDLFAWYLWMYTTYFRWTCCSSLSNSIQRINGGWKARGVADTLLYRIIGRIYLDNNDEEGIQRTLFSMSFDAHEMFLVPTQAHQNIRGLIDIQVITVVTMICNVMQVPIVPFTWLSEALQTGRVNKEDSHYTHINEWLLKVANEKHFLPQDSTMSISMNNNIAPYVSTNLDNGQSIMRFSGVGGHHNARSVAKRFSLTSAARTCQTSLGLPQDPLIYSAAIASFCSCVPDMSLYFNGFDVFDLVAFFTLFGVNAPGAFKQRAVHRMHTETQWELGKIIGMQTGSDSNGQRVETVFGIHCTAILVVASLLLSNREGSFHSNMSSNAARNVLQGIAKFSARTPLGGDGNTIMIKNFYFNDAGPKPTTLFVSAKDNSVEEDKRKVAVYGKRRLHATREYFLRPKYDSTMYESGHIAYLRGRYKRYMYEDVVHMHTLLSFLSKLQVDSDLLSRIPVQQVRFDYNLMFNRTYPVIFSGSNSAATLTLVKEKCIVEVHAESKVVKHEWPLRHWQAALHRAGMIIYALVHRRNALVYRNETSEGTKHAHNEHGYGCITPVAFDTYLDKQTLCYHVYWSSGNVTDVYFRDLDEILLAVGSYVYVPLLCTAFDELRTQLVLPTVTPKDGFVIRGNLYYPSDTVDTCDNLEHYDYQAVYVSVAMRLRKNGSVCRMNTRTFVFALTDLIPATEFNANQCLDLLLIDSTVTATIT